MGKLIFRYGTMSSGKSLHLLTTANNLEENNINHQLLKPSIDTRTIDSISSRLGIERKCTTFNYDEDIFPYIKNGVKWVLIDESQFLSTNQVNQLSYYADNNDVNIICYGLRTDYMSNLFEGSKRLFELSDELQEIPSYCSCGNKTIINAKIINDNDIATSYDCDIIEIGGDEKYHSMCRKCYMQKILDKTEYAKEA